MDLDVNYATTLVAALLLGVGFVLQQYSAEQEPESRFLQFRILTDLLRKPRWLLGIGCMIAGYLVAAWSIDHLELTLVEPLLTTYLVWALVLAVPLSRQKVKVTEVVGALILIAGVALVSASRSITPIGLDFGSFSHWYAAAIIAGVAFVAVVIGHRRSGQVRATLTGLGAGLVFGIQDALTRQTLESLQGTSWTVLFTTWSAYALVGAGIVGIWLMQNAFSAAPLHASLPAIAAGEPLAGIALGIVVFGDRVEITPGLLAIEASGIALLVVGVIAVARSTAFSGLRKITDVIKPDAAAANDAPVPDGQDPLGSPNGRVPRRKSAERPPSPERSPPSRPTACCATAPWPGGSSATRTGSAFTIPRPATAAEPARRAAAAPPAVRVPALRAAIQHPVQRRGDAPVGDDQPPDDHDHGGQGPEIAAHPQDRRADLLVGERGQGDPGHVGVDRVHRAVDEDAQRHRDADHDEVGHQQRGRLGYQRHPPAERRRRDELQPEQHPGGEEAGVHQPDVHGGVVLGQVVRPGQVPDDHDQR